MGGRFSFNRFRALLAKEFIQAFRDHLTFAMMVGVPIIQLILFGYAINSDPHYLPAAVISADNSEMARSIIAALQNSAYFKVVAQPATEAEADDARRSVRRPQGKRLAPDEPGDLQRRHGGDGGGHSGRNQCGDQRANS